MHKHLLWLTGLLVFLVACSTTPNPQENLVHNPTDILGVASLNSEDVTVQALVPGLAFSGIARSVVDADGVRIREIVYEIENTSDRDLRNLTLYGVATPNTLVGTNVSNLRDASGEVITNPDMAPSIIAIHGSDDENADMQTFVEEDKIRVKGLLDEAYPNNSFIVLSRGFVASNITGQGNRAIAQGEKGIVTIAVQYPYDPANPAGYPDSFALTFAFVDEPTPRVTQGDDESNEDFVTRVTNAFSPLPDNFEVVTPNPDNPPVFDTDVTLLAGETPKPPIPTAPSAPTETLPSQFTLTVASVSATADTEVTVTIPPNVQSNVEVLE